MGSSQATANTPNAQPAGRDATELLASEAARALAMAWQTGDRLTVEDMLVRHPDLAAAPQAVLRLISEELLLRREAGERIQMHEILSRFPAWRAELELLLVCHELFEEEAPPDFPQAGDECGEFVLVREIGRGSQGQVFLARQPALCDRPVVAKLTALDVAEHLSLARLQHTGIVPLYLVQDLPERRLRLLCMPFVGGASLAALSAAMQSTPLAERSGKTVADALVRCHTETTETPAVGGPALDFLRQATYEQAICWIGACLADALHFAHWRGLVHFDIKPSNLLLAGDGQPMLLDFHLARGPVAASGPPPDWIGGTQGYMPPEQAAALAALRDGQPIETPVDARADVYALAMVLDELLSGDGPSAPRGEGVDRLRRANPRVTRGLADVLAKCLAPRPLARYADAQSLADDLRRHLADLPLRGVPNRSPLELWRKWRRRRPRSAARLAAMLVSMAALVSAGWLWAADRVRESQQALLDGQRLLDRHVYQEAMVRLERGLNGLRLVPGSGALKQALEGCLHQARRAALGDELHRFVERLRFADGGTALDAEAAEAAAQSCAAFWQMRDRLANLDGPASPEVAQVRADLVDLVVFWLDLQARCPTDRLTPEAAAEVLAQAEAALGRKLVISDERSPRVAGKSLAVTAADAVSERYRLARSLLRAGDESRALDAFRRAVREEPQDFWANFYRGRCAYRLARYDEALNAFSICVALAPRQAECYYNRGLAFASLGQTPDALFDFNRAVELDPTLTTAATNRDALRRQLGE